MVVWCVYRNWGGGCLPLRNGKTECHSHKRLQRIRIHSEAQISVFLKICFDRLEIHSNLESWLRDISWLMRLFHQKDAQRCISLSSSKLNPPFFFSTKGRRSPRIMSLYSKLVYDVENLKYIKTFCFSITSYIVINSWVGLSACIGVMSSYPVWVDSKSSKAWKEHFSFRMNQKGFFYV